MCQAGECELTLPCLATLSHTPHTTHHTPHTTHHTPHTTHHTCPPPSRVVPLPEDAFTSAITARLAKGTLRVAVARRDPSGPAMTEKAALEPDTARPRAVDLDYADIKKPHPTHPVT